MWLIATHPEKHGPLYRAMAGDKYSPWGDTDYLLAMIVDQLNLVLWQRSRDGQRGVHQPKPIWRPGQKPQADSDAERRHVHGRPLTIEQATKLI